MNTLTELAVLFLLLISLSSAEAQQGQVSGIFIRPENIIFTGNNSISSQELRTIFRSAGTVTAQLSPQSLDVYNMDRVNHAMAAVLAFYRNRGFIRAAINGPETDFNAAEPGSKVRLVFQIVEDQLYHPGLIRISGARVFSEDLLTNMLNVQPNRPLNLAQLNAGVQAIQKAYLSLGYLDVDIQSNLDVTGKRKIADILLTIKEGRLYHVGKVEVAGNSPINPALLGEFLPLQSGDIFAEKAFDACLQSLNELGITPVLTDADITFSYDREKSLVNLVINLEGKSARK